MANEITVTSTFRVKKGNVDRSQTPQQYQIDQEGSKGPLVGAVVASVYGTIINFDDLPNVGSVVIGMCRLHNQDETNFVTVGVYDGVSFFPLLELLPGKWQDVYLSRYLNEEFGGTGTGTGGDRNKLMLQADTAACNVMVEAYER